MTQLSKVFGTDGIRGKVGEYPITPDFILKLGWSIGMMLSTSVGKKILIGKDTRISGYMIESALQAGLSAAGSNIYLLGPMPTPGIAYLTRALRADIGIVISASHNPYDDNGIKFFFTDGFKIPAEIKEQILYWLDQPIKTLSSDKLGKAFRQDDARGRYIEYCKRSIPHNTQLDKLKIVIDCANGATYHIAPPIFSEFGAQVLAADVTPNGLNINENCGSTHPETLRQRVLEEKADLGIAFDGDGDRVLMVDHKGEILDGDELIYIIAKSLLDSKHISAGVVGTVMSNVGLGLALNKLGLHFHRAPVGDQYVLECLQQNQLLLGGEPSGHIINLNAATSADGIISALHVLHAMFITGQSLHDLKKGMQKFPQKTVSISHGGVQLNLEQPSIAVAIKNAETKLDKKGRVLIRFSGTEPVVRVMVEGESEELVSSILNDLHDTISTAIKSESA